MLHVGVRLLHIGLLLRVRLLHVRVVLLLIRILSITSSIHILVVVRLLNFGLHHYFEGIEQLLFVNTSVKILIDGSDGLKRLLFCDCNIHSEGFE